MIDNIDLNNSLSDYIKIENQTTNIGIANEGKVDGKIFSKTNFPNIQESDIEQELLNAPHGATLYTLKGFIIDTEGLIQGKPVRAIRRMRVSND